MKKVIKNFGLSILVILGLVLLGVCLLVQLPFDYLKYKRSAYYKKERKKYRLLAGSGTHFEIYNEILKYDLPIRFIENPEDPSLECGRFVFEDILILVDGLPFEWDPQSGTWKYCTEYEEEPQELVSLEEYIEDEMAFANEMAGEVICKAAVVLLDGSGIEDPELAKREKRFLVYENNRAEVLKQFCENAMQGRK